MISYRILRSDLCTNLRQTIKDTIHCIIYICISKVSVECTEGQGVGNRLVICIDTITFIYIEELIRLQVRATLCLEYFF